MQSQRKKNKAVPAAGSPARRRRLGNAVAALGIRIKLQLAFGAVAIMTVIAAAVAIMSFSATESDVRRVADQDVPLMTDALRLSAISGDISAAAARFVSARTSDEQRVISSLIADRRRDLKATMLRVAGGGASGAFAAVEAASKQLDVNLKELEAAIEERTSLRASLEGKLEAAHRVHARITDKLNPIVDDSYFEVVSTAEDVGRSADIIVKRLVDNGLHLVQAMVEVSADTNLATGLLTAGALTSSPPVLALLEDRFIASARRAQKNLGKLPAGAKYDGLRQRVAALVKLANFKAGAGAEGADRLTPIFRAHEALGNLLITLLDDMNFDLVTESEESVKRSSKLVKGLVDQQIGGLRNALEVAAQTHLLTSMIGEASIARDATALIPILDRYRSAVSSLERASATLREADVKAALAELAAFGQGPDSVFDVRTNELAAGVRADQTIAENVKIQRVLDQSVSKLVEETESRMKSGLSRLLSELDRNRTVLIAVAVLSLIIAIAIGVFYVQRSLVRRLTAMDEAMRRLSSGETDLTVPALADGDEIGAMARSLEVFRAGEIERQRLAAEQQSEHAAQGARTAAVERTVDEFRAAVTAVISAVSANAEQMETTARSLSAIAAEADTQAREASSSSNQTSTNVQTVATATDELGGSVREISTQATQAKAVVARAADIAKSADGLVGQLSEGATRIGDVVKLIRAIAEQTNLLALNATIEAARAGDAGRGFAVVASEVKALANQTAKATEEIATQIGSIQTSTGEAVDAIRQIGAVMGDINAFTNSIAAAVEEQSASTGSIAVNVQQAASGATSLAGNMASVSDAINETNRSAGAVLDAANALSGQTATLQEAVDTFIRKVAAA